jgi:hypothetical protein
MCASSTGRAAAFFSASDAALLQEAADGKINVQSACALNMVSVTILEVVFDMCLKECCHEEGYWKLQISRVRIKFSILSII